MSAIHTLVSRTGKLLYIATTYKKLAFTKKRIQDCPKRVYATDVCTVISRISCERNEKDHIKKGC